MGGNDIVSMGIRPSGALHYGSLCTIAAAMIYLSKHDDAMVEICVMDMDFDNKTSPSIPYFLDRECGILKKEKARTEIESAVDAYAEVLGIDRTTVIERVAVPLFSEKMREDDVLDLFKKAVLNKDVLHGLKKALFSSGRENSLIVPYSAVCPLCSHFDAGFSVIDRHDKTLSKKCSNMECEEEYITVSLDEIGSYSIHYMVDPIRDTIHSESGLNIVPIFGGDYSQDYGKERIPKHKRIRTAMGVFTENVPDLYVGPMVVAGGVKLSKSSPTGKYLFMNMDPKTEELGRIVETLTGNMSGVIELEP